MGSSPPPKDYGLEAARGNIPGVSTVNKFGRNIEIDSGITADIWDGGYTVGSGGVSLIWVAPTQARTHQIVSTSADDDGDPEGVGAHTLRIWGLTGWSTAEVSEDITLNGTNNVATSNTYVIIHRMQVLTKGATNVNVGVITATADTDSTVTAVIRAGEGATQMAIYGVPSTQKMYMVRPYANINRSVVSAAAVDVCLLDNPEPADELTNFRTRHTFGLQTTGTSAYTIPYGVPKIFTGPCILKIQVSSSANDMDVSAGFDAFLVDN
jgi:hypothetical protein|tara:strand:- start:1988 stop:2788 length:801 start_codon:yes stop_codon:yes gene_type:complete